MVLSLQSLPPRLGRMRVERVSNRFVVVARE